MAMLRRMTAATAVGEGLDGFDLGIIAVVLPLITADLGLTPVWSGLIAASTLVGIFFGSPIVGWLSDRIGRRTLFTIDIATFVVLGLLQAVVTEPWQLMVVRLLLGVAVGAEYALGAALLSEFAPADGRGRRLAGMLVTWYGGYLVSVVVAYALVEFGGLSWRWVLATSVVPALITLAARFGLPESPRWLMHHGRVDEARAIADRYLGGDDYFREEELDEQEHAKARAGGLKRLFEPGMRGRTLFVCTFYACNVAPYFATHLDHRDRALHVDRRGDLPDRRHRLPAHGPGDDRPVAQPHCGAAAGYRVTARCSTWASWCCAASSIDRRNVGVNVCLTRGRRPGR
jgi:putative MFS transporter